MRCVLLPALLLLPASAGAQDEGTRLFEQRIRPVLIEHCYKCHSTTASKQRGGLLLDSRDALRRGGDNGAIVVPGQPRSSRLIEALRQTSELKMPPDSKLPPTVVADFERWIELGAPDPRTAPALKGGIDFAAASRHWAFQPIRQPMSPEVKNSGWAQGPIDRFVLAKLEAAGLTPSPRADARTLVRRIYFDLVGLPPAPEEIDDFARAFSAEPQAAVAALVDRLLASPHYGERWGRHWLDVARYADTKDGVLQYGDARVRPYAYTYRDYVIRAFNEDVPFDRFIHDQLAADQTAPAHEPWRLAGLGFLTLGRIFDNNIHDILDDRIDVVTRGLLGLTVTCARCHDHKYDPVPQADYYSLYGVFAGSEAPLELPLLEPVSTHAAYAAFEKEAQPKRLAIQQQLDKQYALLLEQARVRVGDYLEHIVTKPPDPLETAVYFLSLAPDDLRPQIVNRWRKYLEHPHRAEDAVFGPWQALMQQPEVELERAAPGIVAKWVRQPSLNPLVRDALLATKVRTRRDVAKLYGKLLREAYEASKKGTMSAAQRQLADIVTSPDSPCYFTKAQCYYFMSRADKDNFGKLLSDLDVLAVKSKDVPPRAMSLVDADEIHEPRIFVRGNAGVLGARVPRRFLRILAGDKTAPFAHGSGRLDLAQAIASPANPLTSRVLVNRVWMHHFGEPLVATPSDFGLRTPPPTHPELLDHLAWTFMHEQGWSLKKLHRAILLSAAYQQASGERPECSKVDPENRLLWRAQRRRLDFEAMRDSLLAISGQLERRLYGRPVDVAAETQSRRRTVYGLVDRQSLPGLFRAFDFAVPDQSVERRPLTTVPQQALFGMNHPFVVAQAKALAARTEESASAEQRAASLYRRALGRLPDVSELEVSLRFVGATDARLQLDGMEQLAQVLLLTNEAMFID